MKNHKLIKLGILTSSALVLGLGQASVQADTVSTSQPNAEPKPKMFGDKVTKDIADAFDINPAKPAVGQPESTITIPPVDPNNTGTLNPQFPGESISKDESSESTALTTIVAEGTDLADEQDRKQAELNKKYNVDPTNQLPDPSLLMLTPEPLAPITDEKELAEKEAMDMAYSAGVADTLEISNAITYGADKMRYAAMGIDLDKFLNEPIPGAPPEARRTIASISNVRHYILHPHYLDAERVKRSGYTNDAEIKNETSEDIQTVYSKWDYGRNGQDTERSLGKLVAPKINGYTFSHVVKGDADHPDIDSNPAVVTVSYDAAYALRGSGYRNGKGDNVFHYYFIYNKDEVAQEISAPKAEESQPTPPNTSKPAPTRSDEKPVNNTTPSVESPKPVESEKSKSEKNQQPIKFRVHYWDDSFGADGLPTYTDIQVSKEIYLQPGQSVTEVAPDIQGYTLATNIGGDASSITLEYDKVSEFPGAAGAGFDGDGTPRIGFHYKKIDAEQPNEVQPEKPAENTVRHLSIQYYKSGGTDRPDGLTSSTGIIHHTVILKPGESYTFPDVTAPGYQLLGVYHGGKELGVGSTISYEDLSDEYFDTHYYGVGYIYGRTPNPVSKEIPAGAVKYRIFNYDDTMDGTVPTQTEVAPAKEGYVLPGETLVIKPSDIPGYTFTKRLQWGADQADSITITTKSLEDSGGEVIQNAFFYTKNPESAPTSTTPAQPPKPVEKPIEDEQPFKYRVYYIDADTGKELLPAKEKFLAPGQSTVELPEKIAGYYDATYGKKVELTKDLLSGKELSVYISEDKDRVPMLGFAYRKEETPDPTKESIKYRVHYKLSGLNASNEDLIPPKEGVLKHAESIIEQPVAIPGYKIADGTFPQIDLNYYMLAGKQYVQYIGMDPDGVQIITFVYQVDPDFKPTPKPEEKPVAPVQPPKLDDKPSEQPITPVKPVETPSEPKTPVVPLQPTTPVTPTNPTNSQNSRVLSNLDGSVRVHGSEITLKDVSYIKVEEVVANPLSSKDYKAFDIHLYDASGKAIQPKGMVVVSVQADKPVEKVYYVAPDGDLQELDFTQEGNKVSFKTNHFSIYALAFRKLEAYRNGENGGVMIRQEQLPVSNESIKADKNEETKVTLSADKQSDARSLPDTGETQSSLSLFGYILALFGLAGWLYQGRHDRKR